MAGGGYLQHLNKKGRKRMNIAKCKLDKRGRITLPSSFLKANYIYPETYDIVIQVIAGNSDSIRIVFIEKGEEE
jgi:hypothetical protein